MKVSQACRKISFPTVHGDFPFLYPLRYTYSQQGTGKLGLLPPYDGKAKKLRSGDNHAVPHRLSSRTTPAARTLQLLVHILPPLYCYEWNTQTLQNVQYQHITNHDVRKSIFFLQPDTRLRLQVAITGNKANG